MDLGPFTEEILDEKLHFLRSMRDNFDLYTGICDSLLLFLLNPLLPGVNFLYPLKNRRFSNVFRGIKSKRQVTID